ncbi:MAG: oxygen-independent coproporphyrinogen III oxidase [Planctomycetota bacterium]|nr:MAG: oxygen-independent coproporphyrinogen III oxidase [Planctomycetota bacterium]
MTAPEGSSTVPLDIDPELLERLSRPGPRYTSYPTAADFRDDFGPDDAAAALRRLGESGRPVSLYVHLPYCRSLCHYCACNIIVTQRPGVASAYLDVLEKEVALVGAALGARPRVTQLHLGGGTPTFLTCEELRRLHGILARAFDFAGAEERAVEVDPRVTSFEQLKTLAELGWNRASFGVQDFDPEVQRAINRLQSVESTEALVFGARSLGYRGINIDLIYGLPFQREETFRNTLEQVIALRPDRIALYSYAHLPWLRVAQQRFDRKGYPLPGPQQKYALFKAAVEEFGRAGYVHLGMDHFALPEDELAKAQARGELHRNFQGYTVKRAEDLIGLGLSSIGDFAEVYAQNAKEIEAYEEAVLAGRLPTCRGYALTSEDLERRELIRALMTGRPLPGDVARRYPEEFERLRPLERDGLVDLSGDRLVVTPLGRFFIRNVAMAFDAHRTAGGSERFSRTV